MLVRLKVFRGRLAPGRVVRVSQKIAAAWIENGWAELCTAPPEPETPTVDARGEVVRKVERSRKRRRRKV